MPYNFSIISVVAGLDKASGGPSYTVPALATAVARHGVRVCLVSTAARPGVELNLPPPEMVSTRLVPADAGLGLRFPAAIAQVVRQTEAKLIHVHGLWMPATFLTARFARRYRIPLVISPRGMLEPWAWKHSAWKKRPVWWLWEQRNLQSAAILHATATEEADSFRQLGLRNPIAVIPNGVDLPDPAAMNLPPLAADGRRTILFLSRIHPKKGLVNLVAAWQKVRCTGWRVVVAGPDTEGHLDEIRKRAQQAGVADDFVFTGAVYGADKWKLYRQADLFVLPTFSENFGVSVAEALAMGVPAITTKGAPWKCLADQRCGWWVDVGVEPLAAALQEAMQLSDEQRHAMGRRGAAMVRERFSWNRIGLEMAQVYAWVLGYDDKPACVQI
ncbi:MAG: glycosyltransferase [Kiritimatiellia bacterium]